MLKIIALVLSIVTCGLSLAETNMVNQNMNIFQEPYFSVQYYMGGCPYEVSVNGMPVEQDPQGIPTDAAMPVSLWLAPGKNTLSITLHQSSALAKKSKTFNFFSFGKAALMVKPIHQLDAKGSIIASVDYKRVQGELSFDKTTITDSSPAGPVSSQQDFKHAASQADNDVLIEPAQLTYHVEADGTRVVTVKRTIVLPDTLPEWKWAHSDNIPDNNETKNELIKQYLAIYTMIKQHEFHQLQPLFTERDKETALSYHRQDASGTVAAIKAELEDPDIEQMVLDEQELKQHAILQVFANGRLARVVTSDGSALITFNDKDGSSSDQFDMIFRKQNNRWVISR